METIRLNNLVPHVFAQSGDLRSAVWRRDVTFHKGHLYLVEAESGKGKSTFCSYLLGFRHDYTGELYFDDRLASRLRVADWVAIRQTHVSHLFQELRLFPELTAMENVEIKNKLTGFKSPKEIESWFERLGIADKRDSKIGLMSFGQQQRVALIRALAQPFDFLLADEPISHLDDNNSKVMGELLVEEARKQGAGVIITSIGKHMALDYDKTLSL